MTYDEALKIVKEQTIPSLKGSGGGGHVEALEILLDDLKRWQECSARQDHELDLLQIGLQATADHRARVEAERDALRGAIEVWQREAQSGWEAAGETEAERDEMRAERRSLLEQLARKDAERNELRAEVERLRAETADLWNKWSDAEEKRDKAEAALRTLLDKMERVEASEAYRSVWIVAQIHSGPYHGENWAVERNAARAALRDTAPVEPEATDGHWPDVNVGNPAPAKEPAERWCPVGCGAHEDPGPWHQRGCARWRDTAPAEEKRSYAPTDAIGDARVEAVEEGP